MSGHLAICIHIRRKESGKILMTHKNILNTRKNNYLDIKRVELGIDWGTMVVQNVRDRA